MLTSSDRRKILVEEMRAARSRLVPQLTGVGDLARPRISGAQIAAVKGVARRRAMARIDALEATS